MNDFGCLIEEFLGLIMPVFNLHFSIFGVELTLGAMILLVYIVGSLLWFIWRLAE